MGTLIRFGPASYKAVGSFQRKQKHLLIGIRKNILIWVLSFQWKQVQLRTVAYAPDDQLREYEVRPGRPASGVVNILICFLESIVVRHLCSFILVQ